MTQCGRCGKSQIPDVHTCTPTPWAREQERSIAELELAYDLLRDTKQQRIVELEARIDSDTPLLFLRDSRIAELEATLKAIAEHHDYQRAHAVKMGWKARELNHTERRDFALKALEGSKP